MSARARAPRRVGESTGATATSPFGAAQFPCKEEEEEEEEF